MGEMIVTEEMMNVLKAKIRNVPDFPEPGIQFKDITTLLKDPASFHLIIDAFTDRYRSTALDAIVAVEARGYILAAPVAYNLGVPFIPVRKPGKLPHKTVSESYCLEYGTNTLHMHEDAVAAGQRILVIDDVIATGGSALATAKLIEKLDGEVAGLAFLIELDFLKGREALKGYDVFSLIHF
jgi:adenine phosphoribosyltransferase